MKIGKCKKLSYNDELNVKDELFDAKGDIKKAIEFCLDYLELIDAKAFEQIIQTVNVKYLEPDDAKFFNQLSQKIKDRINDLEKES